MACLFVGIGILGTNSYSAQSAKAIIPKRFAIELDGDVFWPRISIGRTKSKIPLSV